MADENPLITSLQRAASGSGGATTAVADEEENPLVASLKKTVAAENHVPGKVTPFSGPPATSPTQAAARVGRAMIRLQPPAFDATQIERNVFTGGAREPGIATDEEIGKSGTIGPQPDVNLPGPHGTQIHLKPGDVEQMGKVFLPGANADATLQGSAPIISPERGLVAPQNLMTESEQRQHPILTGLGQLGEGLTTPENLAILAGTAGFGELPAGMRAGLSAYFAAQMAKGATDYGVQGWKAYKRGDNEEAQRLWTLAAGSAVLGGAAGAHAIRETPFAPKVGAEPVVPKGTISEPLARDATPEGAIGPKQEPLAPESPATLRAQTDALARGTNKTVYFPKGTENLPAPPENAQVTVVPGEKAGAGTWYHTKDVKPILILKRVQDGTFGELLGNHQSKEAALASPAPIAVVARDADGNEIKASLVDSTKPEIVAAQAATLQRQFPKAEISVEKPEDVIHERMGTQPKEAEKSSPAGVSQQTPQQQEAPLKFRTDKAANTAAVKATPEQLADTFRTDKARLEESRRTASPAEQALIDQRLATIEQHLTELTGEQPVQKFQERRGAADLKPILDRHGLDLFLLAREAQRLDPTFAARLSEIAHGKLQSPADLQKFVDENVREPQAKAELTRLVADYAAQTSAEPSTGVSAGSKARGIPRTAPKSARATKFSPAVLEEARQEIRAASGLASSFERPGRYFAEHGDQTEGMPSRSTNAAKGIHAGGTWYGVSSSRHIVADQYPWFADMKGGAGKLSELVGKEKGAEYERLVNTVAEHIQREKESAAPVIAEFAPKLKSLAREIDGDDVELSELLAQVANSDGRGFKNLREYLGEKVANAEQARDFYRSIEAAAVEARSAGAQEPAGQARQLRESAGGRVAERTEAATGEETPANSEFLTPHPLRQKAPTEKQNVLPGFESAIDEQRAGAERVRGEELTGEANQALGDITRAAGEMERNSPLFRGTAASPQNEMFEGPTAAVGDRVQVNAGPLEGKSVEVTKVGDSGIYVRGEEGPVKFVKNGDFEAAPKAEAPRPNLLNTAHSNPVFDPEVWKSVLGYLEPSEAAGQADLRARTGELARKQAVLQEKLKAERSRWRGRSDADMLAFADLVENGEADRKARGVTLNPKTQALLDRGKKSIGEQDKKLAVTLRTLLDEGRTAVQDLGTGKLKNFIENYFPHIWEEKSKVGAAFGRVFGKRPLEGPRSFLKKREIPTTAEGFDADLKPVTTNPVDMAIVKMHEMNRYVMAHRLLDDLKTVGSAQFVSFAEKPPEGWKALDDRVFTVYGNPDIPVKEQYDAKVWDALSQTAKNLGIKHTREVSIGGKRSGFAKLGPPPEITTRFATPESIIAHEIGHQLDWKYGLKDQLVKNPQYKLELRKLADLHIEGMDRNDLPKSYLNYLRKGEEKMATMVEALVQAPDKFRKVAPNTFAFLQNLIKQNPELKPLLEAKPSLVYGGRTSTVNVGGMVIHGRYYAPEEIATPINRYVSSGLKGVPIYDIIRGFGNSLNQVQLGLSGFHLGTTSLNAVMSQFALGAKQAVRGEFVKAAKNILAAPAAPIRNLIQGGNVARDYLRPDQAKKYAATAQAIEQAGGRIGMGEEYIDNRIERMLQSFANKKYFTGILQSIPAAVEAQAIPVLKWTVPRMKIGAFHDLAADVMDRGQKNGWSPEKIRGELQKSWDSIDNRFGQVVYDNLNWNKVAKDLAFIGVRSVGWNYGTWRELGGGVRDLAAQTGATLNGKGFDVTDRMAYTFALPVTIAGLGALYMYAHTGKWPQTAKDYFYPKNGKVEEDGTEVRSALPSYMKDVFSISEHPVDTALHKMNPAIGLMVEMLENKDYYGNEIRNTDDPAMAQLVQVLSHVGQSFLPITLRNAPGVEKFMGITPAPRNVERSDAEAVAHELIQRRAPAGAHTAAEQKKRERILALEQQLRDKTLAKEALREAVKKKLESGEITEEDAITAITRSRTPGLVRAFKQLSIPEALKVWDVAMPKEREQLKEFLATKIQSRFPKMTREDQDRYRPLLRRALMGLPAQPGSGATLTPPDGTAGSIPRGAPMTAPRSRISAPAN